MLWPCDVPEGWLLTATCCGCRDASCIVSLTRQFSSLSSVPKTPMNQIEGALAHAESLEMHTMSSSELRKRCESAHTGYLWSCTILVLLQKIKLCITSCAIRIPAGLTPKNMMRANSRPTFGPTLDLPCMRIGREQRGARGHPTLSCHCRAQGHQSRGLGRCACCQLTGVLHKRPSAPEYTAPPGALWACFSRHRAPSEIRGCPARGCLLECDVLPPDGSCCTP